MKVTKRNVNQLACQKLYHYRFHAPTSLPTSTSHAEYFFPSPCLKPSLQYAWPIALRQVLPLVSTLWHGIWDQSPATCLDIFLLSIFSWKLQYALTLRAAVPISSQCKHWNALGLNDRMGSRWTNSFAHGYIINANTIGTRARGYRHVMFTDAVTSPTLIIGKSKVDASWSWNCLPGTAE